MQVFAPCETFEECASSLDGRRLCCQAKECTQLLDTMLDLPTKSGLPRKGWKNHPALLMWKDYKGALINYLSAVVSEMHARGYKTDTYIKRVAEYDEICFDETMPWWWGSAVHQSHRYRLLQKAWGDFEKNPITGRKSIDWYGGLDWAEKDGEIFEHEYLWVRGDQIAPLSGSSAIKNKKEREMMKTKYGSRPYV